MQYQNTKPNRINLFTIYCKYFNNCYFSKTYPGQDSVDILTLHLAQKYVISETFFPANHLRWYWNLNLTKNRSCTNKPKATIRQNQQKLKPHLVTMYDIQCGTGNIMGLLLQHLGPHGADFYSNTLKYKTKPANKNKISGCTTTM